MLTDVLEILKFKGASVTQNQDGMTTVYIDASDINISAIVQCLTCGRDVLSVNRMVDDDDSSYRKEHFAEHR